MSKIQDVPFITKVIDTLSDELKSGLYDLIDGQVKTPIFRSLVNNDYAITEANDKGKVQFVTLETLRGNYTGYLAYNSVYCVLIAFKGNTQALDMLNINVAKHTFAFVNESLSILELRVELEDGKKGVTPTDLGVTNNNIHLAKGTKQIGEGVNFKTINGASIMGDGNIAVSESGTLPIDETPSTTSENALMNKTITNTFATKEAMEKLDQNIAKNTADIAKNTTQIEKLNEGSKILQPYNLVVRMQEYEDYIYDRNEGFRDGKHLLKGKDAQPLEPIRIYQGNTYLLQHIWGYFSYVLYDDGSSFVITEDTTGDYTTIVKAEQNGYICATIQYQQPYEFLIGEVESIYFKNTQDQVVRPHTYIVEKNGNGNFTKLSDAIKEATKYLDSLVYVGDGVWDLISELGEDVEKINVNNRGLYLKNNIHLIFSSNSKVTWHYTGSTSDVIRWGTIFNSGINGFTIENATLEGSNLRYLIHDERDSSEDTYINRYINCKFKMDNSHSTMTTTQCIGGGLGLHGYIVIDNCYFETIADNSNALFWHNSADTSSKGAKSHIILKDSYVAGTNGVGFHYYGNSTKVTEVDVSNCSFGRKINYGPETIDGTSPHINLVVNDYCNKIRSNIVITANSDIISSYDYKVELIDGFYFIHFEATLIDGLSVISNGVNIFKLNKVISHTHAVFLSNDYRIGYAYAIGSDVTAIADMTVNSSKKLICEYFCPMD